MFHTVKGGRKVGPWVFPTKTTKIDRGEIFICTNLIQHFSHWHVSSTCISFIDIWVSCLWDPQVSKPGTKDIVPENGDKERKIGEWTKNEISTPLPTIFTAKQLIFFFFLFSPFFFWQLSSSLHYLIKRHKCRTFYATLFLFDDVNWMNMKRVKIIL